jgi:16S rRNA processing protein RimM
MGRKPVDQPDEEDRLGRLIIVGRIGRVHGVLGWVRLQSYTEPRAALLGYKNCFLRREGEWREARFAEGKVHGKSLIGRLDGIDDREAASSHTGAEIGVPRASLPEPGSGHYYWADLEGLAVRRRDGQVLGTVKYLLATGSNDVLVVQGEREILIPFVMDKVIVEVDLPERVISVDWEWD